jgi:fructose-bisphosphate aldolase class II
MKQLLEIIKEAEKNKTAIGHFNVSDLAGLKAVFAASQEASLALLKAGREAAIPIIIGVSEGEREFIGVRQIAALIKSLREEYECPVFLNADHTKSLEKIKKAVEAGFDMVMFDGSELPLEENIKKTKEVVEYVKSINPKILVEAEAGNIPGTSTILKEIPESISVNQRSNQRKSASIKEGDLTKPDEIVQFIKETGVDILAIAVGNIHGVIATGNPKLDIERIKKIKSVSNVPLVLHGGSGIPDKELLAAIDAGISIIHINTELRLAWRKGIEKALKEKPEEIVPYKLLPTAVEEIKKVVEQKLKLFNRIV